MYYTDEKFILCVVQAS